MRAWISMLLLFLFPAFAAAAPHWQEQPEWAREFSDHGVVGTALIYDEQADRHLVLDRKRAETPFLPASTFMERDGRRWFFAINMDLPGGDSVERIKREAPKRSEIARALLVRVGALPKAE